MKEGGRERGRDSCRNKRKMCDERRRVGEVRTVSQS